MDFAPFDKRGYPVVSAPTGYAEWARDYEATVAAGLDASLLKALSSIKRQMKTSPMRESANSLPPLPGRRQQPERVLRVLVPLARIHQPVTGPTRPLRALVRRQGEVFDRDAARGPYPGRQGAALQRRQTSELSFLQSEDAHHEKATINPAG